jgi:hypothetical protein
MLAEKSLGNPGDQDDAEKLRAHDFGRLSMRIEPEV